jgi:nicotinamide mononucleotide transporter
MPRPDTGLAPAPGTTADRIVEGCAVPVTLLCVWLTAEERVLCWPAGILGALLYIWVFARTRLYSDVLLQAYFVATSVYGWYHWTHGGPAPGTALAIGRLSGMAVAGWILVAVAATSALGAAMRRYTRAALPYWDAAIAVMSLIAQYLLADKVLESWVVWVAVDVLAIGVYLARRLRLTAALYGVLLVLAARGFLEWLAKI